MNRTKPWPCRCWWKCRVAGRNANGTVMLERKCVSGFICNLLEPETQKGTFLPLSHVYLLSICSLLGIIVVNITNTGQWGFWILQIEVFRFWGLMIVYMSAHFSFTSMHFLKNQSLRLLWGPSAFISSSRDKLQENFKTFTKSMIAILACSFSRAKIRI